MDGMMGKSGDGGRFGIFLRRPSAQTPDWFAYWKLGPAWMGIIRVWITPVFGIAWKGKPQ